MECKVLTSGDYHSLNEDKSPLSTSLSSESFSHSEDLSDASTITADTSISTLTDSFTIVSVQFPTARKSILKTSNTHFRSASRGTDTSYDCDCDCSTSADQLEYGLLIQAQSDLDDSDDENSILSDNIAVGVDLEDAGWSSGYDFDGKDAEFDDFSITFANSVRFDEQVSYSNLPEEGLDDGNSEPPMTYHEMAEISQRSRTTQSHPFNVIGPLADYSVQPSHDPDEYPIEILDLDKALFLALVNGIHVSFESSYKDELQTRAQQIRNGFIYNPFFERNSGPGRYLDEVIIHVIGMFRNVITKEELRELLVLCTGDRDPESPTYQFRGYHSELEILLGKIERILTKELTDEKVLIDKDELSFFAGGILYALSHGYFSC